MRLTRNRIALVLGCWVALVTQAAAEETVSFSRDIRALLSDRCFECHGPDEKSRQAELRLDLSSGELSPFADRDGQQVILPGKPQDSLLWQRIISDDPDERMPPADSHKKPLSADELALFKQWIEEGGAYEEFWAFVPPKFQEPPPVRDPDWQSMIDRFVTARLEAKKIRPQPRADKRTLIRRVTFDLTGLPPTLDEIRQFTSDDSSDAWESLVDRLLAKPQYGEHMAKYWLDLVRFADTNGIHHDHYREMTPYRDWVIRAFNQNLPYDEFLTYQVAGDLYENPTLDQQIGSGFNRLHLVIDRGTALPEESYTRNVVDRVSAFGTAFMGLTLGCAVCHDHKYDPVTQRDFYQLFAFFNNIDTAPETPGRNTHPPFIRLPTPEQSEQLNQLRAKVLAITAEIKQLKADVAAAEAEVKAELQARLKETEAELMTATAAQKELEAAIPITLVSKERAEIRPAFMLIRGAYDQPGEQVERNTPGFLPPLESAGEVKSRMDLARWLTRKDHPLTARVAVNRIWQQFFGVGLVKTSEDFGAQGEYPSHPALLDALSSQFVESGWNVKDLVRSIVLSQTYQQSSSAPPQAFRSDPGNRLLARGSRFRMDSEMIRDQILSVSGLLNPSMYGKSVKPPQPPNLWKSVSMVSSSTYSFAPDTGDSIYRRSVYSFWKRAMPPPQMTIFDAPTRESCIARRERTNTPVQALVLMNEEQYFHAARKFAESLIERKELNDAERIRLAYESVTSQLPDSVEMDRLTRGVEEMRALYAADVNSAKEMTAELNDLDDRQRIEIATYTMLMNTLFNLDIAKTRE